MKSVDLKTPLDTQKLRRAFGSFGTGVTIVTTLSEDGSWVGLTANSFNTVSLDPPLIVWSLAITSVSLSAFQSTGRFVINVLSREQIELSQRFSRPVANKFLDVPVLLGVEDLPTLEGCAAVFECKTVFSEKVGDHILFIGSVESYSHDDSAAPLLYLNGKYSEGVDLNLQQKAA